MPTTVYLPLLVVLFSVDYVHSKTTIHDDVTIPTSPCPSVIGCQCVHLNPSSLICSSIGPSTINEITIQYPHLTNLEIKEWNDDTFDLYLLSNLKRLTHLQLIDSWIKSLTNQFNHTKLNIPLNEITFDNNRLSNWTEICLLSQYLPKLRKISLKKNRFELIEECNQPSNLDTVDLSNNMIVDISSIPSGITSLYLESTSISSLNQSIIPHSIINLSLSSSPLSSLDLPYLPNLRVLNLSNTKLTTLPHIVAPSLEKLIMDANELMYLDISNLSRTKLIELSLSHSVNLLSIHGNLPLSVQSFTLTQSKISSFSSSFFSHPLDSLDISSNNWSCDPCFLKWTIPIHSQVSSILHHCALPNHLPECSSIELNVPTKVSVSNGGETYITCLSSHNETVIEWWLHRPATFLGSYDPLLDLVKKGNGSDALEVIRGGSLHVLHSSRDIVERYICIGKIRGSNDTVVYKTCQLRLNLSQWYSFDVLDSVFWGCIMSATLACAFSFLLNITWILSRKSILWWIQRAERLSRVRKMVEAVEKYRTRQMDTIHDNYNKKVHAMRDTYHQQVEQLRLGYSSQVERFRDYRTAQMENVQSHLEALRENYQQQLHRLREYGSRRAEVLSESYERQMNRVRMFNLQSRLKMMRQYNLKQRYINKLFESFQKDNNDPEAMRKHEEEVRAVLNLPDNAPTLPPLSRSPSFYSLPEYVLNEDGNLHPSPLIPSTSPPLSFTHPIRISNQSPL